MSCFMNVQQLLWRFQSSFASLVSRKGRQPRGIGLALSGGVDSMALAWLCHSSRAVCWNDWFSNTFTKIPFEAIVINHKLRPESDSECIETANRFQQLTGRLPITVSVDWAEYGGRPESGRLETVARRARYRCLGEVCRAHQLDMLLTGHHSDDNAETILMRTMSRPGKFGLQGIAHSAPIPECEDMHGVSQQAQFSSHISTSAQIMQGTEPGVEVVRPLLAFDKQDLVTLCQQMGIVWAEDRTNADQTLTARNTLRYLLHNELLPAALQKESLLQLSAANATAAQAHKAHVRNRLAAGKILQDPCSGVVSFVVPNEIKQSAYSDSVTQTYVRELVQAASPHTVVPVADCELFTQNLLKEDNELHHLLASNTGLSRKQLAGRRVARSLSVSTRSVSAVAFVDPAACGRGSGEELVRWHLIRYPRNSGTQIRLNLKKKDANHTNQDYPYMTLWDNRFWLRVTVTPDPSRTLTLTSTLPIDSEKVSYRNKSPTTKYFQDTSQEAYVIRQLEKEDLCELRKIANVDRSLDVRKKAAEALKRYEFLPKLGDRPLVLPIIARMDQANRDTSRETIVAIPSLGFVSPNYEQKLSIDLAYKHTEVVGLRHN